LPKNFGATESRLAAGFQLLGKHYTIAAFRKPKIGGVKLKLPAYKSIFISKFHFVISQLIYTIPAFPAYLNAALRARGVHGFRITLTV